MALALAEKLMLQRAITDFRKYEFNLRGVYESLPQGKRIQAISELNDLTTIVDVLWKKLKDKMSEEEQFKYLAKIKGREDIPGPSAPEQKPFKMETRARSTSEKKIEVKPVPKEKQGEMEL